MVSEQIDVQLRLVRVQGVVLVATHACVSAGVILEGRHDDLLQTMRHYVAQLHHEGSAQRILLAYEVPEEVNDVLRLHALEAQQKSAQRPARCKPPWGHFHVYIVFVCKHNTTI